MLMVKGDERSKTFRDKITALKEYSYVNELPKDLSKDMRQHLELNFQVCTQQQMVELSLSAEARIRRMTKSSTVPRTASPALPPALPHFTK